jgi:protein-S-isoprenylcysteine O-methyltransferase Ste14
MLDSYAYGMWLFVAVNTGIIVFFTLSYLKPKRRWEWRSMGAFGAFTVALFTEMYGFPLTIYILTSALGSRYPVTNPFAHTNGNLWSVFLGGSETISGFLMFLGSAAIVAGIIVMAKAWKQIHAAGGKLVTTGLYGRVRHPQYAGLFLITLGMFIQWPTLVTIAMWPVLMFMYYRLAMREEREMEAAFGDGYAAYKLQSPMFFPHFSAARKRLTA